MSATHKNTVRQLKLGSNPSVSLLAELAIHPCIDAIYMTRVGMTRKKRWGAQAFGSARELASIEQYLTLASVGLQTLGLRNVCRHSKSRRA